MCFTIYRFIKNNTTHLLKIINRLQTAIKAKGLVINDHQAFCFYYRTPFVYGAGVIVVFLPHHTGVYTVILPGKLRLVIASELG